MEQDAAQPLHPQEPNNKKSFLVLILTAIGCLLLGAIIGYYFKLNSAPKNVTKANITSTATATGVLNEPYIHALTFQPLKGTLLEGEDTIYQTPNLKMYSDPDFSFQYPSDFTLATQPTTAIVLTKQTNGEYMNVPQIFTAKITVFKSPFFNNVTTLNDWFIQEDLLNFMQLGNVSDDLIKQTVRQTNVAGEIALYNLTTGQPGHLGNNIVFVHNHIGYDISISSYGVPGAAAAFREIVSSFKFTN